MHKPLRLNFFVEKLMALLSVVVLRANRFFFIFENKCSINRTGGRSLPGINGYAIKFLENSMVLKMLSLKCSW